MRSRLKSWGQALRRQALVVWIAARDPRTPMLAKALAGVVAAYAYSPIDLIPDFIPVLGLLDDAILIPLGVWAVFKLIPAPLIEEFREEARQVANRPVAKTTALLVIATWVALGALGFWAWRAEAR